MQSIIHFIKSIGLWFIGKDLDYKTQRAFWVGFIMGVIVMAIFFAIFGWLL